jgi:hypothetical protein
MVHRLRKILVRNETLAGRAATADSSHGTGVSRRPVSWPGPSRSKENTSRKERVITTEVLGPHAAGNHRALLSEETDDLDRPPLTWVHHASRDNQDTFSA